MSAIMAKRRINGEAEEEEEEEEEEEGEEEEEEEEKGLKDFAYVPDS
jgi:hypothetical protein